MKLSDSEIEHIIEEEIEIDAYSEYEVNLGWEVFLEDNIDYPFEAACSFRTPKNKIHLRSVQVFGCLKGQSDNISRYLVEVVVDQILVKVQLNELTQINASESTKRAVLVWNYKYGNK